MIGFEHAQGIHDNLADPDTDEDAPTCTCRQRDCYDCADYSG